MVWDGFEQTIRILPFKYGFYKLNYMCVGNSIHQLELLTRALFLPVTIWSNPSEKHPSNHHATPHRINQCCCAPRDLYNNFSIRVILQSEFSACGQKKYKIVNKTVTSSKKSLR